MSHLIQKNGATMANRIRVARSYIGGGWRSGQERVAIQNPADISEVVGYAVYASSAEAEAAITAAESAWPRRRSLPFEERAAYIRRVLNGLHASIDDMSAIITSESGKTLRESRSEIEGTIRDGICQIDLALQASPTERERSTQDGVHCELRYAPLGVVLLITPWNFPLATIGRKLIPAIVLGNTAVVKPSEVTPLTAAFFFELVHEADLAAGVANLVQGGGPAIVPPLVKHAAVRAISFTGSTQVGLSLCRQAIVQDTRVQLEMGGKNAVVILADANVDEAVEAVLLGAADALAKRGKVGLAREVVLERMAEGSCVLMLHVGPYDKEKETINRMLAFAAERGLAPHGRHHEIYISDPRRIPPERLKTILRVPVREVQQTAAGV